MPNFDKIKIDGTSYNVHDTETATALSAETQARQQAIQQVENEIAGLPGDWQAYVRNIVTSYPIQTIGGNSTQLILSGFYFIGNDGNFYRATKLIGQGVQIVSGSNCERTYIGAMLETLKTSIDNVDQTISEQLEPLETRVTDVEAALDSVNVFNFDYCVFVGDSYLNQNPAWGDALATILPGCRVHHNYASGGGGFQTSGDNGSFLAMFQSGGTVYEGEYANRNKVTFVLIEGGINDGDGDTASESSATSSTILAARSLFPAAKVAVVYNWAPRAYPNTIWHGMARGALDAGAFFCPNSYLWLWNNSTGYWFQSDKIHPSSVGTNLVVKNIYQWLMSGKSVWPFSPQKTDLSNGMSLIWYIDESDNVNIGIYGTATSNTATLGTAPFCLRPYIQQIFFPWLNVTNLSGTESPYIKIDPNTGTMSTNATFSSQNPVSQWNTSIPAREFGFNGFTL